MLFGEKAFISVLDIYRYFSKALIIPQVRTKKITTVKECWILVLMNDLPVIGYLCLRKELWDRQGTNIASR